MTTTNSILFFIFLVIVYAITVDRNVADLINLLPKIILMNLRRYIMMIQLHPRNPITNLMMRFKYDRIAKKLHKELNDNANT